MALRSADRHLIREWNEALVLNFVRRHEPVTRPEIAERTGLGRSTVTVITRRLISQGLVVESGSLESEDPGRPPVLLRLQAGTHSVVGLKLGPTGVMASVLDLHAEARHSLFMPLPRDGAPVEVVRLLVEAARQIIEKAPPDLGPPIGVGLVLPGIVQAETGASWNPYHPHWSAVPFRHLLEAELELPVIAENDANAAALAERWYGSGQGAESLLSLTVGVGIGAGLIISGALHRGARSGAGEIGHVQVDPQGPLCRCGRRGCLEAVAGDAGSLYPPGTGRERVVHAAQAGDPQAASVLQQVGRTIGVAIANAVNLVSPDRVVVGGEAIMQAGELLLTPIRRALQEQTIPGLTAPPLVQASLGGEAWVRGAAVVVLEEAFRVPLHKQEAGSTAPVGFNSGR